MPTAPIQVHVHLAPPAPAPDRWALRANIMGSVAGMLAAVSSIFTVVTAASDDNSPTPTIVRIEQPAPDVPTNVGE